MKQKIIILVTTLFCILTLTAVYLFSDLWHLFDVPKLANYYPNASVSSNQREFELVKEKPKDWVPLRAISKNLQLAIRLSEDWAFYQHNGIDVEQLKAVVAETIEEKKFTRGASTISQQLVKNIFLNRNKSIVRKLNEIVLTLYMEKKIEKKRIFEIYLNVIEFGKDIYGIKQASWHYFKKSPDALTIRESAFLAMLLPNPKKYSQSFKQKKLTRYAQSTMRSIINKIYAAKYIDQDERFLALNSHLSWEIVPEAEEVVEDELTDEELLEEDPRYFGDY